MGLKKSLVANLDPSSSGAGRSERYASLDSLEIADARLAEAEDALDIALKVAKLAHRPHDISLLGEALRLVNRSRDKIRSVRKKSP